MLLCVYQDTFRENIKRLEAGIPMDGLAPVDPDITLEQVASFISKYEKADSQPCTDERDDIGFGSSISSAGRLSVVFLHVVRWGKYQRYHACWHEVI